MYSSLLFPNVRGGEFRYIKGCRMFCLESTLRMQGTQYLVTCCSLTALDVAVGSEWVCSWVKFSMSPSIWSRLSLTVVWGGGPPGSSRSSGYLELERDASHVRFNTGCR